MMKEKFSSIKWEIMAVMLLLVLAVIALLGFFILRLQEKSLTAEVEKRGAGIAQAIASNIADMLLIKYDLEAAKLLKEAASDRTVVYAMVVDSEKKILAHNDMTLVKSRYAPCCGMSLTAGKNIVYTQDDGRKIIDFTAPAIAKGRVEIGNVHVGISYDVVDDALRRSFVNILMVALLAACLSVMAAFVLSALITSPINELADGAKIIGRGDLQYRIKFKKSNELGVLAAAFNMMTEDLMKAQEAALEQRAMEKELEIARKIQLSLIPRKMPQIEGYEVSSYYQAAKLVGGDYYDVIPLEKSRYGFIMADVSGKGVPAALVMAMASSILRAEAQKTPDPRECVVNFNNELFSRMTRGMFLTVFYGILDPAENTLEFVSAAHNETMVFRKKTGKPELLAPDGFPAGIGSGPDMLEARLTAAKVSIETGDRIIVYTDGIFEAMNENRRQLGMNKFIEIIEKNSGKNAVQLKDAVVSAVSDFTKGAEQFDDMAFLVIERVEREQIREDD